MRLMHKVITAPSQSISLRPRLGCVVDAQHFHGSGRRVEPVDDEIRYAWYSLLVPRTSPEWPSRARQCPVKAQGKRQFKIVARRLRDPVSRLNADHCTAIGIHVGFILVMIHAPPNAISPAYTICGSIAMSAEMSPTIAPSTCCTAFSRSFATL